MIELVEVRLRCVALVRVTVAICGLNGCENPLVQLLVAFLVN